jgi:hypothetical protein
MTDVPALLKTYIERFESGDETDPTDLLEQASGHDRARLSALIDGYLEQSAPTQSWDAAAFESSPVASRAADLVQEQWGAEAAALPSELVALRKQAKLPRRWLVERLASALGFAGETDRVGVYYNAMEHGQLPPAGISSRVFDALASILDTSAEALRKAGDAVAPSAGGKPGVAFARTVRVEAAADQAAPSPARKREQIDEAAEIEPDELDRLFTEGD